MHSARSLFIDFIDCSGAAADFMSASGLNKPASVSALSSLVLCS
jgi:hypothetical protein